MPIPSINLALARLEGRVNLVLGNVNQIEEISYNIRSSARTTYNIVNRIENRDDVELARALREASNRLQALREDLLEFRQHNDEGHETTLNRISDLQRRLDDRADSIVERISRSTSRSINRAIERSDAGFDRTQAIIRETGESVIEDVNSHTTRTVNVTQTRIVGLIETESTEIKGLLGLIETSLGAITEYASASRLLIVGILGGIETTLGGIDFTLLKVLYSGHNNKREIINKISGWHNSVFSKIKDLNKDLTKTINESTKEINNHTNKEIKGLTDKLDHLEEYLKDEFSKLPDTVSSEVSLNVVGQSYYKWDSISQYFPTITFLFKEINVTNYPRHSQIKLRLKQKNTDISEMVIAKLRLNVLRIAGLTYLYGPIRSLYVSSDKRWKSTIFVEQESEAIQILEKLCNVIDEPFNNKNLSFTTNRQRTNPFKRIIPLDGVDINDVSYNTDLKLKLHKVVLLVNGLKSPIIIYKS